MSLILKGIDMPKDCDDCMFNFYREGDSCPACYLTKHIVLRKNEENIPTDCPLVEIPSPHGRMIDRSVLFEEYQNLCNGLLCRDCPFFKENSCSIEEWILNQPPILEAEEKP